MAVVADERLLELEKYKACDRNGKWAGHTAETFAVDKKLARARWGEPRVFRGRVVIPMDVLRVENREKAIEGGVPRACVKGAPAHHERASAR